MCRAWRGLIGAGDVHEFRHELLRRGLRRGQLAGPEAHSLNQRYSADGATRLRFWRGGWRSGRDREFIVKAKNRPCESQHFVACGKMKAVVADFDEALGQDMLQETVEEF